MQELKATNKFPHSLLQLNLPVQQGRVSKFRVIQYALFMNEARVIYDKENPQLLCSCACVWMGVFGEEDMFKDCLYSSVFQYIMATIKSKALQLAAISGYFSLSPFLSVLT